MINFNIGDVVVLKSGGPDMTIIGISSMYETVKCAYYEKGLGIQQISINYRAVRLAHSAGLNLKVENE